MSDHDSPRRPGIDTSRSSDSISVPISAVFRWPPSPSTTFDDYLRRLEETLKHADTIGPLYAEDLRMLCEKDSS
jgi:hypothetical protein